jgi:NADH-quinone oxidoreductase subunit N
MGTPVGLVALLVVLLPELILVILAFLLLVLDLGSKKRNPAALGWVTVAGLTVSALTSFIFPASLSSEPLVWGGMLRLDAAAQVFRVLFLVGAAITAWLSIEEEDISTKGEFYFLLVIATLGLTLLASSADLIMVFLSLEMASIPLYILAGFYYRDTRSVEAGLKYMLYGAIASAIMVFGFTYLYGFSGTTQLYLISAAIQNEHIPALATTTAAVLILVGLGYKISAVPFHFWAPDVYEGAPTVIAGFLSTVSKAGGFAVLLRLGVTIFPVLSAYSVYLIAAMAVASMLVGNLLALNQKNFKRFLAYSSIAQAGYILVGVAASSNLGTGGVIYYLMAYLVTNLVAFAIAFIVARVTSSDEISGLAGLSQRRPFLGFALLISLLSLGGIPPFAGFIGKLLVFSAGIQSGMVWLVVIAVMNSVLSLYYYLNVLKVAFLNKPREDSPIQAKSISWRLAFLICLIGIVLLGVILLPWYGWALSAASSLALY